MTALVIILIVLAFGGGVIASARIEAAVRSATNELHARLDRLEASVKAKL